MQKVTVQAYAASEARSGLTSFSYTIDRLEDHEVLLETSHCGICHSDLHLIDNDWRSSQFPLVPGHEVIGVVKEKGRAVHRLKIGDVVGVGWQAGACLECDECVSGQENLCRDSVATAVGRHGGFGDHIAVDSRFAFKIPDGMDRAGAAPLLCGGITVYSPLRRYDVRPWHKVGVVGIGGLGHLGLQFARAFGCEVTAFSSTLAKEAQAKDLGAHHFVATREERWDRKVRGSLDFILVTATADLDWKPYVRALRPNGRLCFVTGAASSIDVPISHVLGGQKSISGSVIGGRALMREMLALAARQGVTAQTEIMPMTEVNAALDRVRNNQARYRMVLEV